MLETSASLTHGTAARDWRSCVMTCDVFASLAKASRSSSYRVSPAYFTTRHWRFATLCRRMRRASSVDLPENIGPALGARFRVLFLGVGGGDGGGSTRRGGVRGQHRERRSVSRTCRPRGGVASGGVRVRRLGRGGPRVEIEARVGRSERQMRGARARLSRGRTEDDLQRAPRRVHDRPLDGVVGVAHGDGRFVSCRVPARALSGPRAAVGLEFKRLINGLSPAPDCGFRQTWRTWAFRRFASPSFAVASFGQTWGHRRGAPCRHPCTTRSR